MNSLDQSERVLDILGGFEIKLDSGARKRIDLGSRIFQQLLPKPLVWNAYVKLPRAVKVDELGPRNPVCFVTHCASGSGTILQGGKSSAGDTARTTLSTTRLSSSKKFCSATTGLAHQLSGKFSVRGTSQILGTDTFTNQSTDFQQN